MTNSSRTYLATVVAVVVVFGATLVAIAQKPATVLENPELARVVPSGFYFQGQSAPTQMRNAAAAHFDGDRYVIAGLVDTSGYAADVRAKYQGFLISDSSITLSGSDLPTGAYGFGFSNDGKLNIFDLAGKEILSVSTTKDAELKRPRPLMMLNSAGTLRLYSGKDYVTIATK